jgi:hypothetical protein
MSLLLGDRGTTPVPSAAEMKLWRSVADGIAAAGALAGLLGDRVYIA